jgi:hypothetical protein
MVSSPTSSDVYFICLEFLLFPFVPLSPSLGDMILSDPTSFDLAGAEAVFNIGGAMILDSPPIVSLLVDFERSGVRLIVLAWALAEWEAEVVLVDSRVALRRC